MNKHWTREIVNLSSYILTKEEEMVLRKGLTFCPQQHVDMFEIIKGINLLIRTLITMNCLRAIWLRTFVCWNNLSFWCWRVRRFLERTKICLRQVAVNQKMGLLTAGLAIKRNHKVSPSPSQSQHLSLPLTGMLGGRCPLYTIQKCYW